MALKAIIEDISEVDDSLHEHYQEKGDVWVLGVEDIDSHPSVAGLKSNQEKWRKSNDNMKAKLADAESRLEAFGEVTPEQIEEWREAAEKGGQQLTPEEINERVEKQFGIREKQLGQQIAALTEERDGVLRERDDARGALQRERIDTKLTAVASKAGIREQAIDLVVDMGRKTWRLDDSGNPIALNGDDPINGAHGPLTMDEWAESLRSEHDYLFRPNAGGGAAGNGAQQPSGGPRVISDVSNADDITAIAEGMAVRGN